MASLRRRLLLGSGLALLATCVTMCVVLHPIDVTYRLWQYRRDRDVSVYRPELCDRGAGALPHIYEAFDAHGARADIAGFRVAVAASLRCIREDMVGVVLLEQRAYADAPVEPRLVDVIVRAFNQEPEPELRADMLVYMWELDFRARFAIYAGIARGPHPIPSPWDSLPSIDPYGRGRRGHVDLAPIRAEWCRLVAPIARERLDGRYIDPYRGHEAVYQLAFADCGPGDVRLLRGYLDRSYPGSPDYAASRAAYIAFARVVGDSRWRARELLVPLFAASRPCQSQLAAFNELTRTLSPEVAPDVAAAIGPCVREATCRDLGVPAEAACQAHLIAALTDDRRS